MESAPTSFPVNGEFSLRSCKHTIGQFLLVAGMFLVDKDGNFRCKVRSNRARDTGWDIVETAPTSLPVNGEFSLRICKHTKVRFNTAVSPYVSLSLSLSSPLSQCVRNHHDALGAYETPQMRKGLTAVERIWHM